VHVPPTHDWPAEQALSQAPQLKTSVLRSTQLAAHIVCPGTLHVVEQVPAEHTCPAAHATPHAPQLSASVAGFVQAPLHGVSPTRHSHAPAMHDWPVTQTTPQAPQWLESMLRSTQAEAHRVWPVWQPEVVPSVRSEELHATRTSAAILATMGAIWMSCGVDTLWIVHACGARASVSNGSAPRARRICSGSGILSACCADTPCCPQTRRQPSRGLAVVEVQQSAEPRPAPDVVAHRIVVARRRRWPDELTCGS
jgi:hypothetical protein